MAPLAGRASQVASSSDTATPAVQVSEESLHCENIEQQSDLLASLGDACCSSPITSLSLLLHSPSSHVQLGALHRSAPGVRRQTTLSFVKKTYPTCPSSCVSCPASQTRVRSPVCPAQASQTVKKKKGFLGRRGREGRWPQMVSTQGDFCAHAWTRARRATDRDLESAFHQQKGECLDMCTAVNRP